MPINDFDKACRRMVKEAPLMFLRWLFVDFVTVARHVGWVDTRRLAFPGDPDQTGDLVFELETLEAVGPPWAVALEFQIEPASEMFGWLLRFLGVIHNERHPDGERSSRYQLGAVVINLTGTSRSLPASAAYTWPGQPEMSCGLKAPERHLETESAEETLAAIASGRYDRALLPWIPLMKGGSEDAAITQWLALARQEPDDRRRADLGYNALVFAEKSADPAAWRKALEGWEMVKSQVMEETRNEGRSEGRSEGRQESLLELLRDLTGQDAPAEVVSAIRACSDPARLRAWIALAAAAGTLAAFRQQTGL